MNPAVEVTGLQVVLSGITDEAHSGGFGGLKMVQPVLLFFGDLGHWHILLL